MVNCVVVRQKLTPRTGQLLFTSTSLLKQIIGRGACVGTLEGEDVEGESVGKELVGEVDGEVEGVLVDGDRDGRLVDGE